MMRIILSFSMLLLFNFSALADTASGSKIPITIGSLELKDITTLFFAFLSLCISIIAILISRKDEPSFMPAGEHMLPTKEIQLSWKNASGKNIYNLTVLINFFNKDLDEISNKMLKDKYLYPISGDGNFFLLI